MRSGCRAPNLRNPALERSTTITAEVYRVNGQIRARSIRVVDDAGEQLGILDIHRALEMAEERGLDLVEVAPNATPPVCRLMDFGKFKYEQKKKFQEAKKKQLTIQIKEVKLRPQTDTHDLDTKIRHIRRFITEGDKVKLNVFFRGREMAHPELGEKMLARVADSVKDIAKIEAAAAMEGRRMIMVLGPDEQALRALKAAEKKAASAQKAKEKPAGETSGGKAKAPRAVVVGGAAAKA